MTDGQQSSVLVSTEKWKRRVMGPEDFTETDIVALESARPPADAKALDDELPQTS
ncbi:hypothetical protein [Azospirillum sp. B2RO_4]|uniref:hypothetical protein n=1 Tax=Azospirillum sp. B2RO_4 TaxID=3027796 RepID=UPI003DA81B59